MKNLNKQNLKLITYHLILILFKVSLIAYFLFFIFNLITNHFVDYYLNFCWWLYSLIILGLITFYLRHVSEK